MSKSITAAAVVALAAGAASAQVQDLIIIDLTVQDQVTLTATTGTSALTVSGPDSIGVYFENFYGGGFGEALTDTGTGDLTSFESPSDGTPSIFRSGGAGPGDRDPGLNMWSWTSDSTANFQSGEQAFIGSATFTLTSAAFADMLAGGATGGNIYFVADDVSDLPNAQIIGTYSVIVPSTGVLPLLAIGAGAGLVRRRR